MRNKLTVKTTLACIKIILTVIVLLTLLNCGQRGAPSGGPKDETPPKIVKSSPGNYALNFNQTSFYFKFDEYVQLKAFEKNLIISPPVEKKPKFYLKGKTLFIEFDTLFRANTTYNIYFGEGITDFNEGNILDSNHFVFSTGDYIDSLSYSGKIIDAFTLEPEDDCIVGLYQSNLDSFPAKKIPTYFTKAKNGVFTFNYLAEGNYKIFALRDENNNYKYDKPTEKIAFWKESVLVSASTTEEESIEIELKTFVAQSQKQFVELNKSNQLGKIQLCFKLPVSDAFNYQIPPEANYQIDQLKWNFTRDTLTLIAQDFKKDFNVLKLIVLDENWTDTLNFRVQKEIAHPPTASFNSALPVKKSTEIALLPALPFKVLQADGFKLYEDTTEIKQFILDVQDDEQKIVFKYAWRNDKKYHIKVLPYSLSDMFYTQKDTLLYRFNTPKEGTTANLLLNYVFSSDAPLIIEVIKNKTTIRSFYSTKNTGNIQLKELTPGSYAIRVIEDWDGNKSWTSGNFFKKQFPEKTHYYPEPIELRANWDIELTWDKKTE